MSGSTLHLFPRPMSAVPTDATHAWLPDALEGKDARLFTNAWRRLQIPWSEVRQDDGRVLLYAHQHVADPRNPMRSRWCCPQRLHMQDGRSATSRHPASPVASA